MAAAAAAATERPGHGPRGSGAAAERRGARGLGLALGLRIPGRKEAAGEARALIAHAHGDLTTGGESVLGGVGGRAEEGGDAGGWD